VRHRSRTVFMRVDRAQSSSCALQPKVDIKSTMAGLMERLANYAAANSQVRKDANAGRAVCLPLCFSFFVPRLEAPLFWFVSFAQRAYC
jgi:hypothetical protein